MFTKSQIKEKGKSVCTVHKCVTPEPIHLVYTRNMAEGGCWAENNS